MTFKCFWVGLLAGCSFVSHASSSSEHLLPDQALDIEALSQSSYWLKLGHYLPTITGRYVSTVDAGGFFLSPEGKTNPAQELAASISVLYQDDKAERNKARCTFPARFLWLESQHGRTAVLPDCPQLQKWQDAMSPEKLTLVFPTAFMNNPSSMFGHTLLRVDAKNQNKNNELVAYAINFAAEPDSDDNAALFAIKGLIGSYPSRFTVMPYYHKVREYNDIESRDIWEYPLNFTQEEVNRILLHLWEMEQAEFEYYFLDENCSYHLLSLLQLANDELELVSQFKYSAIPSDTVRALVDAGLTQPPNYRPSFGTRLLDQSVQIDERIYLAAKKLKEGVYPSKEEFTDKELAAIYEFSYEWLNYELYDEGLEREITAKQLTKILIKRSQVDAPSPFLSVPVPKTSPEQGHDSARVGLIRNINGKGIDSTSLELRLAYHDMLDAQGGFIPGAQISFFDTNISVDDRGTSRLEHLYLLDVYALAPSNRVFDSLAWNIKTGFDRPDVGTDDRIFLNVGAGKAWGDANGLYFYSLLKGEINHGSLTSYDWVSGIGAEAGLFYSINEQHRFGMNADWIGLFNSTEDSHSQVTATWNWSTTANTAIRTEVGYRNWHHEEATGKIAAYLYY
ncbi:DUF4105 domain-containing protein [Vibrio sp. HN007]|uniref:Lnb N-terminal periplasmic domain-containing protein n=1 Tax=Vibrio iocasae TaxID=3098914 RepID=UPI0035D499F4